MRHPRRWRRLLAVTVAALASTAYLAAVSPPAQAAGPRPLFQLPFPCGESWRLSTYAGHDDFDIDMIATSGSTWNRPILASYGGTVEFAGLEGSLGGITPSTPDGPRGTGPGYVVKIDHGDGWRTLYMHMIAPPIVQTGQTVTIGQQLGRVGSTGDSGGAHLHFEQQRDRQKVEAWFNGVPSGITTDGSPSGEPQSPSRIVASGNCGRRASSDYDGDGRSDMMIYRPSTGNWGVGYTGGGQTGNLNGTQWGNPGDIPLDGDYDGDGKADMMIFRPSDGTWHVRYAGGGQTINLGGTQWGQPGDIPLDGDYDGDSKADMMIYRPADGSWSVRYTGGGQTINLNGTQWGQPGDVPFSGDYDGDGKADMMIFRPSDGSWSVRYTGGGQTINLNGTQWGQPGDMALDGDYDGDGKADMMIFRPSDGTWHVRYAGGGQTINLGGTQWGQPGDIPLDGDYNNDGKADMMIYRPADGSWSVRYTGGSQAFPLTNWGQPGDLLPDSRYQPATGGGSGGTCVVTPC